MPDHARVTVTNFLTKLDEEKQVPVGVREKLKRLAADEKLGIQSAIESAVREEDDNHGETQISPGESV